MQAQTDAHFIERSSIQCGATIYQHKQAEISSEAENDCHRNPLLSLIRYLQVASVETSTTAQKSLVVQVGAVRLPVLFVAEFSVLFAARGMNPTKHDIVAYEPGGLSLALYCGMATESSRTTAFGSRTIHEQSKSIAKATHRSGHNNQCQ